MDITKFVKDYLLHIIVYSCLLFICIADSIIALLIFSVLMHILLLMLLLNLYVNDGLIDHKIPYKNILYLLAETGLFLTILGIRDHWYTFIITACCFFMTFLYRHKNGEKEEVVI